MKEVPYHGNPGNACALACYVMVAQYLFPNDGISFDQVGKIANWKRDFVVWAFPVWNWLIEKNVCITNYDIGDMKAWAEKGIEGLEKLVAPEEFRYYEENTYDLEALTPQVKKLYNNSSFNFIQRKLSWEEIVSETKKSGICDLTLDGRKLHRSEGFTVHRVVLIEITDNEVVFHDPIKDNSGAYRRETVEHFRDAVDSLSGPELTRYSLKDD